MSSPSAAAGLSFAPSEPLTLGVELELQLVNTENYNLTTEAESLLRGLARVSLPGAAKPEITQSMIEVNSSVHKGYESLLAELRAIRATLVGQAKRLNVRVCGGGSHPFQKWQERRIFPGERFEGILEKYGYLAKQFTVFGQHIHIGCRDGDEALYLAHALGRYVPHLVALSAASPYFQGEDTSYHSCRLSVINAFPLSGVPPLLLAWSEFEAYFDKLLRLGVVQSMKDFYWDIRPKPEYGTVEVRVCDTPLTVERAALLAAYAQALASYLIETRPFTIGPDQYLVYNVNRFQAARYGLEGEFIDPVSATRRSVQADLKDTLGALAPYAAKLGSSAAIEEIAQGVAALDNDAQWLRRQYKTSGSLTDLVRRQCARWASEAKPTADKRSEAS